LKREATWGVAAVIAMMAAVGISTRTASTMGDAGFHDDAARKGVRVSLTKQDLRPGVCSDLEDLFRAYLAEDKDHFAAPNSGYPNGAAPSTNLQGGLLQKASGMKFVIAAVPDPLHTHLALPPDRFAETIQQAAQDEGFTYDSSWLPWETGEQTFTHLSLRMKLTTGRNPVRAIQV
jgi:hypothetical protein